MSVGILYYTCLTHRSDIEMACRKNLLRARNGLEIGSVSRGSKIDFGDWNIVVDEPRSPLTMHRQIYAGLRRFNTDYVFLCESDVLYHPSHFEFIPPYDDVFFYNTNVWKVRYPDGRAVWTDDLQQVSGICANRSLLMAFYKRRIAEIIRDGFNRHYEPHPRYNCRTENWRSRVPNLDIRHDHTLTKSKWSPDEFRNARYSVGWREASEVEGWGITEGRLLDLLTEISNV